MFLKEGNVFEQIKSLPWIDDDLRNLMKYRNLLHKKAIKESSQTDWDMYKMARNRVNIDLKRSKATYFHYICSSKIHPSQLWKHLNNVLSRKQRSSVKSLIVDGIKLMDKTKIAEAMNSHFISAAVSSHTSQKLDLNTNSCTSFIFYVGSRIFFKQAARSCHRWPFLNLAVCPTGCSPRFSTWPASLFNLYK